LTVPRAVREPPLHHKQNLQLNLETCHNLCRDLATPPGSARYYSLCFLPKPQRQALTALYAWQEKLLAIKRECSDKNVALAKLNWWREETRKLFAGEAQHPISKALQEKLGFPDSQAHLRMTSKVDATQIHAQHFYNILNAVESDLTIELYQTDTELQNFFLQTSGVIEQLSARLLGGQDATLLEQVRQFGAATQALEHFIHLRRDLNSHALYLSAEQLAQHEVSLDMLYQKPMPPYVKNLLQAQLGSLQKKISTSDCAKLLPHCIMLAIQQKLCTAIVSENYNVLTQHIRLTPLTMWWCAAKHFLT